METDLVEKGIQYDEAHPTPTSPLWQEAIRNYYTELAKGGIQTSALDKDLWKTERPEQLIAHVEAEVGAKATGSALWAQTLMQLKPVLLSLIDFVALSSWLLGVNAMVAVVFWGSVRLIIKYAQPVLPGIIKVLKSLENALPRTERYEKELPMTEGLESALSKLYGEIIVFCAHALAFLRNSPEVTKKQSRWSRRSPEITVVMKNIHEYFKQVDEAASMVRPAEETSNFEKVTAIRTLGDPHVAAGAHLPCYMVPYGINLRFFGREAELQTIKHALDPPEQDTSLRTIRIHGLGGVGKSQLALQYANTLRDKYQIIAWIPAENRIKLIRGLSQLAVKLGITGEVKEDDAQNVSKLRNWLNSVKHPFLLIFDNVEDSELLQQIWPTSAQGSIIITTRSPSQASTRTANRIALEPFPEGLGEDFLHFLTGQEPSDAEDEQALRGVCGLIGRLPLALMQISDFIRDRGCSYVEFLTLYQKSAEKIFATPSSPLEYDGTVLVAWDMSFNKLSDEATRLQHLLVFFDPDVIPERLITNTKAGLQDTDYEFLLNEFDFGEAVMELNRTSMVTRLSSAKALSIHRIVQLAVFSRLSTTEKIALFDLAVRVLSFDFPNTWKERGSQQGHGWPSWETYSAILPHVSYLMRLLDQHRFESENLQTFAELIFRSGTYLWEKEQPTMAKEFFEFGLRFDDGDPANELFTHAHRLVGNIYLDLAKPRAALDAHLKNLKLRESVYGPNAPPISETCDSIACAYTEAGDTDEAFTWLDRAVAIHEAHPPGHPARTLAIRSMTFLRAGRADDALEALRECWRLQGKTQEDIENSRYPKHSGDIMLLARILWIQDKKSEAQELVSRTIKMRRGMFGENGGPRVGDSLFTLARMLEDRGELPLAAKLLAQIVTMSDNVQEMTPHLARALWFSANVEAKMGSEESLVTGLRQRARDARSMLMDREWPDEDTDEGFMRLVGWMLW